MATKSPSVLFVCLGNICRSPTAEAVFRHKVNISDLDVQIDSAGTAGYHVGSPPDQRSAETGAARGYSFAGLSCRRVADSDFESFDLILAMDNDNLSDLLKRCPDDLKHKVQLMLQYGSSDEQEVPDPYYGGKRGFEYVLDLIEDASDGLVEHFRKQA